MFTDRIIAFPLIEIGAHCFGPGCLSYYYPGSIRKIRPFPAILESIKGDVVTIHGDVGLQVDFWDLDDIDTGFDLTDCAMLGGNNFALRFCVRNSKINPSNLVAGLNSIFPGLQFRLVQLSPHNPNKQIVSQY